MNYHFINKLFLVGILYTCLFTSAFATSLIHRAAEDILYGTDDFSSRTIIRIVNRIENGDKKIHLPPRGYEESKNIIEEARKSLSQIIEKLSPNCKYLEPRVQKLIEFDPYSAHVDLSIFSYLLQEVDAEMGPID